mgnify:FL=1
MDLNIGTRLKHAWNSFLNRDPTYDLRNLGSSYSYRPDRPRLSYGNNRAIVSPVYNRIALDVASMTYVHCRTNEDGNYLSTIDSSLNNCLNLEANIDQSGRAFIQDVAMSMMDEGCVAMVPIDTTLNPAVSSSYEILTMRVGKILEWYPANVKVRVYNDRTGEKEDIILPKKFVGIVENPMYSVMNEPNSTVQRLKRKLSLIDVTDDRTASGKMDLIISLPYSVRTELKRNQANDRMKDLEDQLANSKYGIGYIDSTEHVTQLNRSLENNLMKDVEYLTNLFYSQVGITQSVLDGTADDKTMLNYYNRSIEPIVSAIVDEMRRKFLTKTARSQHQSICAFRDPFRLVPVNDIAEIADKLTRNEILTSNEVRQKIGMKPSDDPKADMLINSNINQSNEEEQDTINVEEMEDVGQNG